MREAEEGRRNGIIVDKGTGEKKKRVGDHNPCGIQLTVDESGDPLIRWSIGCDSNPIDVLPQQVLDQAMMSGRIVDDDCAGVYVE